MAYLRTPGPLGRETVWKYDKKKLDKTPEHIQRDQEGKIRRYVPPPPPPVFIPIPEIEQVEERQKAAPVRDGQITLFEFSDLAENMRGEIEKYMDSVDRVRQDMDRSRRAIFVNGMGNKGEDNKQSACTLSLLLMCPVISVYNKTDTLWPDLMQCLRDKISFQAWPSNPKEAFELLADKAKAKSKRDRIKLMTRTLGSGKLGNKAAAATFRVLVSAEGRKKETPIYAHSQGNLIVSNALQAVKIVLGANAIKGRKVLSYGSPAITWPAEVDQYDHAFTFDLVNILCQHVPKWRISKVGWPDNTINPFTHGFLWYLQEDAAFIINRHRIGGWGMTMNMDEEALAKELVSFGRNEGRLRRVFRRLDKMHNSDVDDVTNYYVDMIRKGPNKGLLRSMPLLVKELIQYLDEGWTTSDEKERINYLKAQLKA